MTQEKHCLDYAIKHGFEVVERFIEQGESAKTDNRPEWQRLIAFCSLKKNHIQAVIAYKIDRISRNTDDYSKIRIFLKRIGVEIKSTSEYFENTPAGRFMENIIVNVGQFDNDVRTERCVGGMKDAMREGRYVWKASVGYDNVRIAGKANIQPNEMASVIKSIFERVAENVVSIEEVWRDSVKEGLISRYGKRITKSHFYKMLKNEAYAGWIAKFGEKHKGCYEPIITQDLFDQVQWVLKYRTKRKYLYTYENPTFPLRRFVRHSTGLKLTGHWSRGNTKTYPYYRFMLPNGTYRKELVEKRFTAFMDSYRLSERHLKSLRKDIEKNLVQAQEKEAKEAKYLERRITELREKQNRLIQKNLDGIINDSVLSQQLSFVEGELSNCEVSLEGFKNEFVGIEEMVGFIGTYLKNPGNIWLKAAPREKILLQWFEFPNGVEFDGSKFQTPKIAMLFNSKKRFSSDLSYEVDLVTETTNSSEPFQEGSSYSWYQIGREILSLHMILQRIEGYSKGAACDSLKA